MILIAIPSESCPECGIPGGQCSLYVNEIGTFNRNSIKVKEEDLRSDLFGKVSPSYREGYVIQKVVCLKGKGIK